jgi:hypothetical protein
MKPEEIVLDVLKVMEGIGGIPSNEDFYAEFDMRVKAAFGLADVSERSELLLDFLEWYWETYTKDMFHKDVVNMYIKSSNSR